MYKLPSMKDEGVVQERGESTADGVRVREGNRRVGWNWGVESWWFGGCRERAGDILMARETDILVSSIGLGNRSGSVSNPVSIAACRALVT